MRTYHVRLLIPKVIEITAEDEDQALETVAEFYKELYTTELREWIDPELQPEDVR